jgi:broad specificity phosphatase PhoE
MVMRIFAMLFCLFVALPLCAREPAQIILVRHAERTDEKRDPVLTEAGVQRAQELVKVLSGEKVTAVITTPFKRNRLTADPLARHFAIEPTVVPMGTEGVEAHVVDVVKAVRAVSGGTVVVVGHSNTLAPIAAALGGGKIDDYPHCEYSRLVTLKPGPAVEVTSRRFGVIEKDCR